ncbi:MAG: hypothetical protein U9N73_02085 [Candidatus Auribacterota bacterium]|nr:hypothetical protein [Candidatus Auribacterota bacterium]
MKLIESKSIFIGGVLGLILARPYSKRYFKLFVLKKLNIHHEGHEEHEEKQRKLWNFLLFFKFLRELRVLRGLKDFSSEV